MTRAVAVPPSPSLDATRVALESIPSAAPAPIHLIGTEAGDELYGTAADELIEGAGGDDSIETNGGNDTVLGGAGNDRLIGGDGNDYVDGGEGDDWIFAYGGDNIVLGGRGADTIMIETFGNNSVDGGEGNDRITVSFTSGDMPATTVAHGGAGDDVLDGNVYAGSLSKVILYGDAGSDLFSVVEGSPDLSIADFDTSASGDRLHVDNLVPDMGTSNPFGKAGFLRLVQQGADTLLQRDADGAAGTEYGFATALVLSGVNAASLASAHIDGNFDPSGLIEGKVLTGSSGNDKLVGTASDDTLIGGAGHDTLQGNSGADVMRGDSGNDAMDGGAGADRLDGGAGNDTIDGGDGNDELLGGAGNDHLSDSHGDDQLYGGDGDDELDASSGSDVLSGGNGNDKITTSNGNHVADGGAGNDTLSGQNGNMQFNGGSGDDVLSVDGSGNQGLFGGSGRDLLRIVSGLAATPGHVVAGGGAGNDTIVLVRDGGNTEVIASGGAGSDTYELSGSGRLGTLTIKDFAVGTGGDRFDVTDLFSASMRSSDPYAAGILRLVQRGSATVVVLDNDGSAGADTAYVLATVENVAAAALKANIVYADVPAATAMAPLELVGVADGLTDGVAFIG
ncbi:calcium-binding protein [Massilia antarctica]|uniref:calcium-binding protein n=1 Tax=Massilia antarctica TaxID=2765360 RepID=UPI0006BB8F78|nr:calcium-binding protein [Massilia sp. H27-R4]MCY0914025.1 calcium-binding protein [Massilia sp. H27-R4]CUI04234.1 Alkaline phosphatase [Janthinobacterium sp. CG23_2]CUU28020.1 Alkaline phosphatase [Janthinobacterium sp. CG23_2]